MANIGLIAELTTTQRCSGIECGKALAVDFDWVQLDMPNNGFLTFCGLGCLRTWVMWQATQNETSVHQMVSFY